MEADIDKNPKSDIVEGGILQEQLINGLARAIEAFTSTRYFYQGMGELSSDQYELLLHHAARVITAYKYEQRAEVND